MADHALNDHGHGDSNPRALASALGITLAALVVEVVGGLVTGSLALLADAGHISCQSISDATASRNCSYMSARMSRMMGKLGRNRWVRS